MSAFPALRAIADFDSTMNSQDEVKVEGAVQRILVCSVFELKSTPGYFAPPFSIRYEERGSNNSFFINGGGTRLYVNRVSDTLDPSIEDQAADSHFAVDRIVSALISGAGLFWASPKGRMFIHPPIGTLRWNVQIDLEPFYSERVRALHDAFDTNEFGSWFAFICQNKPVRRALHDAVQAIKNPVEAFVYIYRGFEWLKVGLGLSWDDIACDVGVTTKQIRELGQLANDGTGVRHASTSGLKLRADLDTYGTWIAGLLHATEAARARVDGSYAVSTPNRIANKLKAAVQYDPYP